MAWRSGVGGGDPPVAVLFGGGKININKTYMTFLFVFCTIHNNKFILVKKFFRISITFGAFGFKYLNKGTSNVVYAPDDWNPRHATAFEIKLFLSDFEIFWWFPLIVLVFLRRLWIGKCNFFTRPKERGPGDFVRYLIFTF